MAFATSLTIHSQATVPDSIERKERERDGERKGRERGSGGKQTTTHSSSLSSWVGTKDPVFNKLSPDDPVLTERFLLFLR